MENTLLRGFIRSRLLRTWTSAPDCPAAFRDIGNAFGRCFGIRSDDPLLPPNINPKPLTSSTQRLPPELAPLIPPSELARMQDNHINLRTSFTVHGRGYSTATKHLGNSLVLFHANNDPNLPVRAASIQHIFYSPTSECWKLAVQCHNNLEGFKHFCKYPDFPLLLFSPTLQPPEVICANWIKCHFARYRFCDDKILVVPLLDVGAHFV